MLGVNLYDLSRKKKSEAQLSIEQARVISVNKERFRLENIMGEEYKTLLKKGSIREGEK